MTKSGSRARNAICPGGILCLLGVTLVLSILILGLPGPGGAIEKVFKVNGQATEGNAVFPVPDGYLVLTSHNGHQNFTKFDLYGKYLFSKDFFDADNGWPHSAVQTSDGGYLIAGLYNYTRPQAGFVTKLNSSLGVQWARKLTHMNENADMWVGGAKQTSDGGYIVLVKGQQDYYLSNIPFFGLVKLNSSGGIDWQKSLISFPGQTDVFDVIETSSSYVVYGSIDTGELKYGWDLYLGGVSKSGNSILWQIALGGDEFDGTYSDDSLGYIQEIANASNIVEVSPGYLAIAAYTKSYGLNPGAGELEGNAIMLYMIHPISATDVRYDRILLDGPEQDRIGGPFGGPNLIQLSDGNLLLGGYTRSNQYSTASAFLAKIAPDFSSILWQKGYLLGTPTYNSFEGGMVLGLGERRDEFGETVSIAAAGKTDNEAFFFVADANGNIDGSCAYPVATNFSLKNFTPSAASLLDETYIFLGDGLVADPLGSLSGESIDRTINLVCYPEISVTPSPAVVDYGDVNVGAASASQSFTIANSGGVPGDLIVTDIMSEGPDYLMFLGNLGTCQSSLFEPGDSCTMSIPFRPTSAGPKSGFLRIYSNDPNTPVWEIPLEGTGISTLTVNRTGSGTGSVSGGGISCGSTCTQTFNTTTSVILTAAPDSGSIFTGWSGEGCSGTGTCTVSTDVNRTVTATFTFNKFALTTTASPPAGGSFTLDPSGGFYDPDTPVTVTANANAGYRFDRWEGDLSGSSNPASITMSASKSVTAVFVQQFTLTADALPSSGGSVGFPTGPYDSGSSVKVTATAALGYRFDHWSGDLSGSTNPVWVTMDGNKSVTAVFVRQYTLTAVASPSSGGSIGIDPATGPYDSGSLVTVTATANAGYRFDHWTGDLSVSSNPVWVTMDGNKSITAVFVQQFSLTATASPLAGGSVGLDPATGPHDSGSVVDVTATANAGYRFDRWTGDLSGSANPAQVTMNGNKSVTAVFVQQFTLTADALPSSGGSVGFDPATGPYDSGSSVQVTANASAGYRFDHWAGDLSGSANPAYVTMSGTKSVTAVFIQQYALTATASPSGGGSVTFNPLGGSYDAGTPVTVTANANPGYRFDHWTGDLTGSASSPQITMDGDKSVTAHFIQVFTLATAVSPPGAGSVGLNPSMGPYDSGSAVTVTANPNYGYHFDHWTGALGGSTNPSDIIMDGDKSVTAHFAPNPYGLTVTKSGTGSGSVSPSAGSLSWTGNTGTASYDYNTGLVLTASEDPGSVFGGWSGCASNPTPKQCSVTMTEAKSVTANFIFDPGTPYITDVTPDPFGLGETVTIAGLHFGTKKGKVYWGTAKGKVLTWEDSSITFSLKKGAPGIQDVMVVANKVESNTVPAELGGPTITGMSVDQGSVGAPVTLYGEYFGTKTPKVYFRSETTGAKKKAKVSSYDAANGSITVAVPKVKKGDYGPYVIYVVTGAGTSNEAAFQVNP